MMHLPQLIISDLDGTLIENRKEAVLSSEAIAAITGVSNVCHFAVATGRSWDHFFPVIQDVVNVLAPCIISGGSQIIDPKKQAVLWEAPLSLEQIAGINSLAKKYALELSYSSGLQTHEAMKEIDHTRIPVIYILHVVPENQDILEQELASIAGLHIVLMSSWDEFDGKVFHITHESANKGHALKKLMQLMNLDTEVVVAIGDAANDLPMLEVAGTALAIAGSLIAGNSIISGTVAGPDRNGIASYLKLLQK